MPTYRIEVSFLYRNTDTVQITARCQGQAERMAIELIDDQPGGPEHEINRIESIE